MKEFISPAAGKVQSGGMCRSLISIFLCTVLLSACAGSDALSYRDTTYLVFFGKNIGNDGNTVSEVDWAGFEKRVIATELVGYTVLDGLGGYVPDGKTDVLHEDTKVLIYVALGGSGGAEQINGIVQRYMDRFDQESVLVIIHPSKALLHRR
ncbi:MAG: DUF3574 domain-containing protein [Rhodospirillaceae bacterium]|nr:DUF3574 domain-containing protein [Rhodospirillaceae bacterium]